MKCPISTGYRQIGVFTRLILAPQRVLECGAGEMAEVLAAVLEDFFGLVE